MVGAIQSNFGFYTRDHRRALNMIWYVVCTVIPSALWRLRNTTVHEGTQITIPEGTSRVWQACLKQLKAVSNRQTSEVGGRIEGICMRQCIAVLEHSNYPELTQEWRSASLFFDGGVRGNLGPGASGRSLLVQNPVDNDWELIACGHKYQGTTQTNNFCEYEALKEGLAYAWHELDRTDTKMEVYGDNQMIIQQRTGQAQVKAEHIMPSADRVEDLSEKFKWITWSHRKREYNKMADFMANVAMGSKSTVVLTASTTGPSKTRFESVQQWIQNDLNGEGSLDSRPNTLLAALKTGTS